MINDESNSVIDIHCSLIRDSERISELVLEYKKALENFINNKEIDVNFRYKTWCSVSDHFKEHSVWIFRTDGLLCERIVNDGWHECLQKYDTVHLQDRISEFYDSETGNIDFEYLYDNFDIHGDNDAKETVNELLELVLSKNLKSYDYAW